MTPGDSPQAFAARVIDWQQQHGRHGLPWQATRDPYRVWLSEIMLQQTQVATVLGYYPRFLARFPDVAALATATQDEVLSLWSGLGYYSRARHLHHCAREIMTRFGGQFPRTAAQLNTLPGIGRSTAAAIAAFCFGERAAILDGNVKRVLTRVLGIDDDLSMACHERALWARAESLLPTQALDQTMPAYTQGLMDLGAGVCTRRKPACLACPLHDMCVAARQGQPERYPVKTSRVARSQLTLWLLHVHDGQGRVYLQPRPAPGIWAGLYCLPLYEQRQSLLHSLPAPARQQVIEHQPWRHALTHRDLDLHVISAQAPDWAHGQGGAWLPPHAWQSLGLPAPVRQFLLQFQ